MKPATFRDLGEPETVAEQLLRDSLTTQREEVFSRLAECPANTLELLALAAEAKVIQRMMKDAKSEILRHRRKGIEEK